MAVLFMGMIEIYLDMDPPGRSGELLYEAKTDDNMKVSAREL